jgi:hypothetical protein
MARTLIDAVRLMEMSMVLDAVVSFQAIAVGGILIPVGIIGLTLVVLLARQPTPEQQPRLSFPGVAASVLAVVGGALLVGFGLMTPLADLHGLRQTSASSTVLLTAIRKAQSEQLVRVLLSEPKYKDPKKLSRHEYKAFSQNGEDGAIAEIIRRIGTTNRYFVEFGASNGFENNTVLLLRQGWGGLWIDGDRDAVTEAQNHFAPEIKGRRLTVIEAFITAENIEDLFRQGHVPEEFDLLSIDIDRNDYYVWEKITHYRPRIAVVEYNALYPPTMSWVIPYDPKAMWDRTSHTGASLKALEELGRKKGYSLVGCNLSGVNAFFIRDDLLGDQFAAPYTAENHYEPMRASLDLATSVFRIVP